MSDKKLFLLDGHALVYRAHFAFINRPLINSKGLNTSAISGFTRTLWDIIQNQKPTHIAVAFDPHGPVFRHRDFPEYKANREEQPEDIRKSFPYIKKILKGMKIPVCTIDDFEADDVIGTLAKQAEKEGFSVYMVTPDKDYAQLVSDKVFMYKPSRQGNGVDILGEKEILEKWDIQRVDQVIDVLGLQGDSVDNIPGIPGIGPKTAVKLLKEFDNVDGIIANAASIKGKNSERVVQYAEQARLSKQLATIKLDVPIQFDAEKYIIEEPDKDLLSEVFKEIEFRSIAKQILGESSPQQGSLFGSNAPIKEEAKYSVATQNIDNTEHQYHLAQSETEIQSLIKSLEKEKSFSFDTETTGLNTRTAELVGMVFSFEKAKAYYVPVSSNKEEALTITNQFKPLLENKSIIKIGQNIKYDMLIMKNYNVDVAGYYFDTMIAHYLIQPDQRHKLDYISESYLNYSMVPIEDLIGKKGKGQKTMRDVPIEKVQQYAGEDADITLQVKEILSKELIDKNLLDFYNKVEEPLVEVLADMEYTGVFVNGAELAEYSISLGKSIAEIEKSIYDQAEVTFNIASPKQVGQLLFEKLNLPYRWKKAPGKAYSTSVEKLEELSHDHKIVRDILEFRKFSKLKSTYVDALPKLINAQTGRIHTNYNQTRAATGRLSSDNPNLQNIPIKNAEGREIRKAFKPMLPDQTIIAADYSQIELRLIADLSKDEEMLQAFIDGLDFHRATAAKVFAVPYDEVTADQRRKAKTVNFSITYGAGSTNLSQQLDIKRSEATEIIQAYFNSYKGLKTFMDDTVNSAREKGYVQTLLGRKRWIRDINSKNGFLRSNAERMAINTPVQGTAADMIKLAMINIFRRINDEKLRSKMIMQVHDELVFEVFNDEKDSIKTIIQEEMPTAMDGLSVPILVEIGEGNNWLEAH